jgi:hypothetical protein
MSDEPRISENDRIRLATLLAAIRWKAMFARALQHREVRRRSPESLGHRFVCTEIDGGHACSGEEIDPGQRVDVFDLVPANCAEDLEKLLAKASDGQGALNDEYWKMLQGDLLLRGATEELFQLLEEHRQRDALGAFFVGVELALDVQGLPPLQWRNGVDEHGSPRF